jgi:hypothetical protein
MFYFYILYTRYQDIKHIKHEYKHWTWTNT